MIGNENLGGMVGAPVMGPNDDRFGTVEQVFVDPHTGAPNWVTVKTGLFGRHETFVPLDEATWDREVLHVPYEKALVKDAPRIDTDEALGSQEEEDLYRYYGMHGSDDEQDGQREESDDSAPASESMRLRKYEVTEEKDVTVPVTHEEVRVEPEPTAATDGESRAQSEGESTESNSDQGPKHRA